LTRTSFERLKAMEADREGYEALMRITHAVVSQPALVAKVSAMFGPGRLKMAAFLEQGVALGALRNDLPIGTLMGLIEAVKTSLYQATFPGDRVPTEPQLEDFSRQVIDLARRIAEPPREGLRP
jgi:hypothetical protein